MSIPLFQNHHIISQDFLKKFGNFLTNLGIRKNAQDTLNECSRMLESVLEADAAIHSSGCFGSYTGSLNKIAEGATHFIKVAEEDSVGARISKCAEVGL